MSQKLVIGTIGSTLKDGIHLRNSLRFSFQFAIQILDEKQELMNKEEFLELFANLINFRVRRYFTYNSRDTFSFIKETIDHTIGIDLDEEYISKNYRKKFDNSIIHKMENHFVKGCISRIERNQSQRFLKQVKEIVYQL